MALVSTLVGNVKKLLDFNNSSEALISVSDIDALNLDEIIEGTLVNAARYIESNAPAHLVDGEIPGQWQITAKKMNNGLYKKILDPLPSDYLRLLAFKDKGWERPGKIIFDTDPEYALQVSKWGLSGTPEDPVVAIVHKMDDTADTTSLYLEAYSSTTNSIDDPEVYIYLPLRKITGTGSAKSITVSARLQSAIEYYSASLVCTTYGNVNLAQVMLQQALTLAEIPTVPVQQNNAQ